MYARRFLYVLAALIFLLLAAGLVWSVYQVPLMRFTFVPRIAYEAPPPAGAPDYARPEAWLSHPGTANDPALWLPPGVKPVPPGRAAIFFVQPTSYFDRAHWNAAYDDKAADATARIIVASEASAFSAAGRVWAPRYRQATVGAFLTSAPDGDKALALAYSDVARAFDAFLAEAPADAPIILAGHSQGSFHLLRLLREKVAGTPVARRIVATYAVGWPISLTADLPALGLPACTAPAQTGCLLSWQSFAEPADASQFHTLYDASTGPTGLPRRGTPALCVNPLTGGVGGAASAPANLGSLVPDATYRSATLVPRGIPARCGADGLLLIGGAPDGYGVAVLPGNNFHVFDYALFWANVRADALRRLAAFGPPR
jgi:hypothetical protein